MCGIFGTKNISVSSEAVKQALFHRGPDAFGEKHFYNWNFYHTRLSILDLSDAGTQPMEYNGNYLCFNGEIYNYKELQETYLKGENLNSQTDSEVLLRLLCKFGMSILNKLNGMFAFAFYEAKGNVYLARDRYGVKPLYYWHNENSFAFSSEDRALVSVLHIPYVFNKEYADALVEKTISDDSENSLIKNVCQVLPGCYIKISETNIITKQQWYFFDDAQYTARDYLSKKDILDKFENILTDAIRLRNRSDVQVGITLSGGLDSSIIYVLAKEKLNAQYKIFTYSNARKELDEYDKVKRLADDYGDEVIKITQQEDTMSVFLKSLVHLNAPIWAPSHTGYFNVYKAIKEYKIKVILEGHGADELLGGWPWTLTDAVKEAFHHGHPLLAYHIFKVQQQTWNSGLEQKFNNGLLHFFKTVKKFYKKQNKHCFAKLLDNLFSHSILPINLRCWDRLSMANSIESRSPFLDYRVVEFLKKLPLKYKVNKLGNKAILREILLKYGKNYIVENKVKQGYLSSEIDFLNANHQELLKYYDDEEYNYDISRWKQGTLDYTYSTAVYRIIALNMLKKIYSAA